MQDALVQLFGDEVARNLDSKEELETALLTLIESAREELQGISEKLDSSFAYVPILEEETSSLPASTNIYAEILLSAMRNTFRQDALVHTKHLLLDAAIDVSIHGEDALARHVDPFGDGPFTYERTDQGFILRSRIESRGEKLALRVGDDRYSRNPG
jgi:hypothetical protein